MNEGTEWATYNPNKFINHRAESPFAYLYETTTNMENTILTQLECGAKSADQVQEMLDERIKMCYESMQRMCDVPNPYTAGMFTIFKLCFVEDLKRLGLEI